MLVVEYLFAIAGVSLILTLASPWMGTFFEGAGDLAVVLLVSALVMVDVGAMLSSHTNAHSTPSVASAPSSSRLTPRAQR